MEQEKTLNDFAADNVVTGMLLLCKEALITAIQDRRLHRGHLKVLAAIASYMNLQTAKAWPSREAIATCLDMPVKTISNLLLELRGFGYLIAEKQAVAEAENRRLTVYTFGSAIDRDTIERTITEIIMQMRSAGKEPAAYATNAPQAKKVPSQRENLSDESPVPTGKSRPDGKFKSEEVPPQRESPVPAGTSDHKSPAPAGTVYNNNTIPPSDPEPPKRSARPRTRLPSDWEPNEATIQWALQNFEATRRRVLIEAQKFRDHHLSKGSTMADWPAAWRTWWGNGFHKIPRRLHAQPDMLRQGAANVEEDAFKEALRRAREAEEGIA